LAHGAVSFKEEAFPMPVLRFVVNERQLATAVRKAARALAPDVVRIRYTLKEDSLGYDAVFFRVLLTDRASREDGISERIQRIERKILDVVDPKEKYGLEYYFNYRNVSEQAELKEKIWE
jgi:hypothetical protein